MKKCILICLVIAGIFKPGSAQISYYKSINSGMLDPYTMIISPDNRFCYVAPNSSLQVYSRNESTGELTLISTIEQTNDGTDIYWTYSMVISSDSNFLYLGFRKYIGVFEINSATGLLTPTMNFENWEGSSSNITNNSLVLSLDGRHLYCAVRDDVFLFNRDSITGHITLIEEYSDITSVEGMSTEASCALSPDNVFLYVTGGHSITSFRRDATTGLLSYMQEITGSNLENVPLTYAHESMVSFDNRFLYTITNSMGSGAAVVLSVDPLTDSLSILQSHFFNYSPFELTNPRSMTLSPNHKAFVVSSEEEAAFFEIDTVSGNIELINTFFSRSQFDNNMGGKKIYDYGNQYLYSCPAFEDSIFIYSSNMFYKDHYSFCPGGSAELSPFIGYQSYLWSTGSTQQGIIVTDSGRYILQATDHFNHQLMDTAFVAILPLPDISLGNDTTILPGESIELSPGFGYAQYLWNIDNWTYSYYYFTNDGTITADSIEISVMVTDEAGCINSDTIVIRLKPTEGITEPQPNTASFTIFPNPAGSSLYVCSSLEPEDNVRAEIYSLQGAMLFSAPIKNNSMINVAPLNNGLYLLKLICPRGIYTARLVINKGNYR